MTDKFVAALLALTAVAVGAAGRRTPGFVANDLGSLGGRISEAWGVPLGTVKTRLRLAMNKLRDTLTEAMP